MVILLKFHVHTGAVLENLFGLSYPKALLFSPAPFPPQGPLNHAILEVPIGFLLFYVLWPDSRWVTLGGSSHGNPRKP